MKETKADNNLKALNFRPTPKLVLYIAAMNYLTKSKMKLFNEALLKEKPKITTTFKQLCLCYFDIFKLMKTPKMEADPLLYNYLAYIVKDGRMKKHRYLKEYITKVGFEYFYKEYQSIPKDIAILLG